MSADDARYPALENILRLALIVGMKRYRPSSSQLAEQLGVNRRTVLRYLSALRRAGWRVPPAKPATNICGDLVCHSPCDSVVQEQEAPR